MYIDTYGLSALYIAINNELLPEQAFKALDGESYYGMLDDKDTEDMIKMREPSEDYPKGMYYSEIAEIYGVSASCIFHRIKKYLTKRKAS